MSTIKEYLTTDHRHCDEIFASMEEAASESLQNAKEILLGAGFDEKNIIIKSEIIKSGVARDIVKEAQSGYSTIVLGRRGVSGIKEFILGSVSQKVFNSAKDISVLVVN